MSDLTPAEQADAWNAAYPVGTRVRYWPVLGRDGFRVAETTSPAWAIPSGAALVSITGQSGGVSLTHVQAIADDASLDREPHTKVSTLTPAERATPRTALENVAACHEGVTRRGEYVPCDRPAVGLATDPEEGGDYPVCPHHIRGRGVPIVEVLARHEAEVRAKVAAEEALVEGSWFRRDQLPEILANFMRASEEHGRDAKRAWLELEKVHAARVAEGGERRDG